MANPALGGYGRTDIKKKYNAKKRQRKWKKSMRDGLGKNGPDSSTHGKGSPFYGSGPDFPRYT